MVCPEVLTQAYVRGAICDGIICGGDNKSFEKIKEVDPYGKFGLNHNVKRYECLSHCCKRQKAHLIQWQKDKLDKPERARPKGFLQVPAKKMSRRSLEGNYLVKIFLGGSGLICPRNPLK